MIFPESKTSFFVTQYAFSGHSAAEGRQISAAGGKIAKIPPPIFCPKSTIFAKNQQFFAENRQDAANISIFRLLGDLARQYQVFWAKMPPMNLDQKGY